jgi:hypothetical protein
MTDNEMKKLIARHDRLKAEMEQLRPQVQKAVIQFGRQRGYLLPLRIEQVRPLVGLAHPY